HRVSPCLVVRRLLVRPGALRVPIYLDQAKAGRVIQFLNHVEARDPGLLSALDGVRDAYAFERFYIPVVDYDVDDDDEHTKPLCVCAQLAAARPSNRLSFRTKTPVASRTRPLRSMKRGPRLRCDAENDRN